MAKNKFIYDDEDAVGLTVTPAADVQDADERADLMADILGGLAHADAEQALRTVDKPPAAS